MENKVDGATWIRVTILVAIIGCIGAVGAAFIEVLPDLLKSNTATTNTPQLTSTVVPTSTNSNSVNGIENQETIQNWELGELIYQEDFEDGLINGLKTKDGKFDIIQTNDGNSVWRTTQSSLSQVILPTTSNDYAVETKIMQVSGTQGFGFIEIRMESGEPCGENYGVYLDAAGDWLNLVERGTNCEELREEGLFSNYHTSISNNIWYTLRIEAKDTEVRVYLNEKLVAHDKDIDGKISKSSTIGFSTCCGDLLPYTFDFDDIKVWLVLP